MEAMAQEWNDDRLDALSGKVTLGFKHVDERLVQVDRRFEQIDQRFDRVESEVHALRSEMKVEFRAVRDEMNGIRGEMGKMTARIDSVQRAIIFGAISLTGAILAGFAGIFALLAAAL
jgi:ABC-type phosphate transport system auxiliary subunit